MNILFLAHRIPYPPDKGEKLRAFHQIRHLAKSHSVTCACFIDNAADQKHVRELESICADVIALPVSRITMLIKGGLGLLRGRTITQSAYHSTRMFKELRSLLAQKRFDAVIAFSSSMAPYALACPAPRRVLDLCDVDSGKWADYAATGRGPAAALYGVEAARLRRMEIHWAHRFDALTVITGHEARILADMGVQENVYVVRNGIPATRPSFPDDTEDSNSAPKRETVVGFVGAMDYRPNVDGVCWFAEECWPGIRRLFPETQLRIVGHRPTRAVRRLNRSPGIDVIGSVDDVRVHVEQFTVSVAPLRIARGLQNKVIEAMALARPVVLTSAAARGVGGMHGREYLVADTPREITTNICTLLNDPTARRQIAQAGQRFVQRFFQWEHEMSRFESLLVGSKCEDSRHTAAALTCA